MITKIGHHLLLVILLLSSMHFFYEGQFFGAVILLVICILRFLHLYRFSAILQAVIVPGEVERKANCELKIGIDLEKVLSHPIIQTFHAKLKEKNSSTQDFAEWQRQLLDNFKKKFSNEYPHHSVTFNLKNGVLFKNGQGYFLDSIYEELLLPYDFSKEESFFRDGIEKGLCLRILVVNGALNLEVGRFSKEYSPEVYQDNLFAKYQHFKKITSFPLMLTAFRYGLPIRYMNAIFTASQYYKDRFLIQNSTDKSGDWGQFKRDSATYETLVMDIDSPLNNSPGLKGYQERIFDFNSRARSWLIGEKFIDPTEKEDEDFNWRWDDGSARYSNDYLEVELSDLNARLEKMKEAYFPDYWEEQP